MAGPSGVKGLYRPYTGSRGRCRGNESRECRRVSDWRAEAAVGSGAYNIGGLEGLGVGLRAAGSSV